MTYATYSPAKQRSTRLPAVPLLALAAIFGAAILAFLFHELDAMRSGVASTEAGLRVANAQLRLTNAQLQRTNVQLTMTNRQIGFTSAQISVTNGKLNGLPASAR